MDMGSQKTHNVCASASVHEVCLERGQTSPELPWGHFSYGYGAQGHGKSLGYVGVHGSQKKGSLVLERWKPGVLNQGFLLRSSDDLASTRDFCFPFRRDSA